MIAVQICHAAVHARQHQTHVPCMHVTASCNAPFTRTVQCQPAVQLGIPDTCMQPCKSQFSHSCKLEPSCFCCTSFLRTSESYSSGLSNEGARPVCSACTYICAQRHTCSLINAQACFCKLVASCVVLRRKAAIAAKALVAATMLEVHHVMCNALITGTP
jgi:hypothetical protein